MTNFDTEIKSLLSLMRSTNIDLIIFEKKIEFLKKKLTSCEFNKIINGSDNKIVGKFNYRIFTTNTGLSHWCLKSQFEYEIYIKKNTQFNPLYQKLKSINI